MRGVMRSCIRMARCRACLVLSSRKRLARPPRPLPRPVQRLSNHRAGRVGVGRRTMRQKRRQVQPLARRRCSTPRSVPPCQSGRRRMSQAWLRGQRLGVAYEPYAQFFEDNGISGVVLLELIGGETDNATAVQNLSGILGVTNPTHQRVLRILGKRLSGHGHGVHNGRR
jgi:hypothetical protein